ncbi:MAG: SWIM zinc finger family protein [Saprospiraceae bacterium]|nr:SWIM zinc finger family protein [Saprospiraceae bacterium]
MAKKYGVTWWGQQWLHSLSLIDYSNRLPRGKALAITGKVRSIEFKGNQINAKVQGDKPVPFRVGISVPLFTTDEKKRLLEAIIQQPSLLDKISRRELPQELLKIAESQHIKVFPESWRDFSLNCSCPESGVPCEHVSAVIFEMAEEMDKNQFLAFEMHEMHLLKELNDYYNQLSEKKSEQVPSVENLLQPPPPPPVEDEEGSEPKPKKPIAVAPDIDFTLLPEVGGHLMRLFKPQPVYKEVDLMEAVIECYESASAAAEKFLKGNFPPADITGSIVPGDRLQMVLDPQLFPKKLHIWDEKNKPAKAHADELLHLLLEYDLEAPGDTHPTVAALLDVMSFSLNIAEKGAILPQLLACGQNVYRIRWVPLMAVEEVRLAFDKLAESLPPSLLLVEKNGMPLIFSQTETLNTLCSLFIGDCVRDSVQPDEHVVIKLLHGQPIDAVQSIENEDDAQLLQRWLQPFYPPRKDFAPVLRVEDLDGEYSIELLVEQRSAPLVPPVTFSQFLQQKRFEHVKDDVVKDIAPLADIFPPTAKILATEGKYVPNYNPTRFLEFMVQTQPVVAVFGIKTILPQGMETAVTPKAALLAKRLNRKKATGHVPIEEAIGFEWQVQMGNEMMSVKDFEKLVRNEDGLVKWHDKYVLLDEDELMRLFDKLEEPPKPVGNDLLQALLSEEYSGMAVSISLDAATTLREYTVPTKTNLPRGLTVDPYLHQLIAYDWLLKNARLGFGSVLADDLGLGKTLPILAAIAKFKEEGLLKTHKALVVVPQAFHANWVTQVEKFASKIKVEEYRGEAPAADTDLVLASYNDLRSDVDLLREMNWHCIVLDEAQRIKNPHAGITKMAKSLDVPVRIAVCSTEVESSLASLWSLMDFANPGYLGTWRQFTDNFVHPIRREHEQRRAVHLRKIVAPFVLRRRKTDKLELADMPKKVEHRQYAAMAAGQAALYENIAKQGLNAILAEKEPQRRQNIVVKLVTALKQVCNHPFQYLKKGATLPEHSGKAELLFALLDNIYENKEKVVILTQYQETAELLVRYLKDEFTKEPMLLLGSTNRLVREQMVDAFQAKPEADTIIVSLRMGGPDLNFSTASHLVHFDTWWNPMLEAHASRSVLSPDITTWRLITKGSLEERIDEMFSWKKELEELTAGDGETWLGGLNDRELEEVIY